VKQCITQEDIKKRILCRKSLLEKLAVAQQVEKFATEPEGFISCSPLVCILSQINPVHPHTLCSCKIHFSIALPSSRVSTVASLLFRWKLRNYEIRNNMNERKIKR
jgi:hypothetical protein